jgi:hypothetical protein
MVDQAGVIPHLIVNDGAALEVRDPFGHAGSFAHPLPGKQA